MDNTEQLDQIRFSASGWRRLHDTIETEKGGKLMSAKLVQLARLEPGDMVLDVAGGYGEPSLTAARAVGPAGRVICNDISGDMLAFAQERAAAAGIDNVEFVERDAEQLDFEAASFDAILSRCGLMFLPNLANTLAKFHSFLKPGGHLAALVWGPPPSVQMMATLPILVEELGLPAPQAGTPGPFALADAVKLATLVEDAGFRNVETGTLTVVVETDSPMQFTEFAKNAAPTMILDRINAQPPEIQQHIWDRVTERYSTFQEPGGRVHTENQAIWVVGTKV